MHFLTIFPSSALTHPTPLDIPGDKSLSHRSALLAAIAEGPSRIDNFLLSGVTRPMLAALQTLRFPFEIDGNTLSVQGQGLTRLGHLNTKDSNSQSAISNQQSTMPFLDCGNSATTLRLLAGGLSASGIPAILDGSPGLRRRPMRRIVEPLRQMGVEIAAQDGCAPLEIKAFRRPLNALEYILPVASAQVKSCLLLAALAAAEPTTLTEPGPSRDHTERMLGSMGVEIETYAHPDPANPEKMLYTTCLRPPNNALFPLHVTLPGDMSAAAFLIVATLITPGSRLILHGVGLNPTRTGLLDALQEMGANIQIANLRQSAGEPMGDLTIQHTQLHGIRVYGEQVVRMIDEFPIFAVAAAYARGETLVAEAEELRYKESDRISAMCNELRLLGVHIEETPDGFRVQGGAPLSGGIVQSHGDHRLAMSLTVAGLSASAPITVLGAEMMEESFPGFDSLLSQLGAKIERNS